MTNKPVVYVACPYSDPDTSVVSDRIAAFCRYVANYERSGQGHTVSALYNQLLFDRGETLPTTWEFWKSYSETILSKCDMLIVLTLPGWEKSTGVQGEIAYALEHNILTIYTNAPEKYNEKNSFHD